MCPPFFDGGYAYCYIPTDENERKMEKLEMEFTLKTSSKVLYTMLSTPSGLSRWFADDVNIHRDGTYIFLWEGSEEHARMTGKKRDEFVRYKWVEDEEDHTFFEFRIRIDPLTKDVALIITDFCEEGEEEETQDLWEKQVDTLRHNIGG